MFEFAWPWLFLLLPLPWLLRRALPPTTPGQALRLPQPGLRPALAGGSTVSSFTPCFSTHSAMASAFCL